jgi:ubiquinone/menaquinone biosynthesis C-methylase UbiE
MRAHLARFIPAFMKPTLRKLYYLPIDALDRLKGRDDLTPPKSRIFVGDGDFRKIGQEFRRYFIDLAELQPNERVLDVGCGFGRMAVPLTNYLSPEVEYWGFDIVREGIEWCQKHISSRFKNFHFQHFDVYNKSYNRKGRIQAKNFAFPFPDGSFDFVFLISVFTHMIPKDMDNYLSEIARVIKPGGGCLTTFFLLNDESIDLIRNGCSTLDFQYKIEGCLTINENNPESAIAYREDDVLELFGKYGLKVVQPVHYGSWCQRTGFLSYQDILVAEKDDRPREPLVATNRVSRAGASGSCEGPTPPPAQLICVE